MTLVVSVGLIFIFKSFHVTKAILRHKHGYSSRENVFGPPQKLYHYCGQKKPKGTSSAMFNVGNAAKCCEFKRYVLRLDSMLRELSELSEFCACYASY